MKKPKRLPPGSRPCCSSPKSEFHSSWQDETGRCANCGKYLSFGSKEYWKREAKKRKSVQKSG